MVFRLNDDSVGFPDPRLSEADGFLAFGGEMTPEWLLNAYYMGIFPWYDDKDGVPFWYSPDPRMLLRPSEFRCSKTLRRLLRSGRMVVRVDTAFRQVIEGCSHVKRDEACGESWITSHFIDAYCELHRQGFAHSFETYLDGRLVGGLYGVSLSDYFCGESMFHLVDNASKVAFARMVEFCTLHNFRFVDAQMYTPHLASLGAKEVQRDSFLGLLSEQDLKRTYRGQWKNNSVVLLLGSNVGERVPLLMRAVGEVASRIGTVSCASSLYETEPWGFEAEQNFLNQAVVVDTNLEADEVLRIALDIEKELGRVRSQGAVGYASRTMDIDLIFYNSTMMDSPHLTLPHPRMQDRRFVLEPLVQIIPDFRHPKTGKTMRQLLEECTDLGAVKLYF